MNDTFPAAALVIGWCCIVAVVVVVEDVEAEWQVGVATAAVADVAYGCDRLVRVGVGRGGGGRLQMTWCSSFGSPPPIRNLHYSCVCASRAHA